MIQKVIDTYCQLIGYLIAAALAVMVALVFGNVVMRYAFNSGFTVSEELSRWLFVWVTFLGAVIAMRDNAHLGTDMLVSRVGPKAKRVLMGVSLLLMMLCLWLIFKGTYEQFLVNIDSQSPVMEVSMGWFFAGGMVFSALSLPILLLDLYRLLTGQIDDDNLVLMQESEDTPHGNGSPTETHN